MLALALALLAAAAADTTGRLMSPGISQELAAYRAARVANVRYDLRLTIAQLDTAKGQVVIRFDRTGDGDAIIDFRGPRPIYVVVNGTPATGMEQTAHHLRIPAGALRPGANEIAIDFSTLIAAAGASIIRYRDATDGKDYLYTLLVPADANQLFPCFDQPDLKARVTLTIAAPASWTVVANGRLETLAKTPDSRFVISRFHETEPISTYLIAFAAGPWAKVVVPGLSRPIAMYVRESRVKEVEQDSIIQINARALDWLERYFAVPFPFQKYDVVLAPAFPFGGMEHPGAVFYSEDRFIFRERPTLTQRLGRTSTIYHEVAHQWFGDYVTMRWFDDLWLKEGFSTYVAAKMQAELDPGSDAWKSFYLRIKPPAYGVDLTRGTTPVWQQLANLDQAKSAYGPIVYNKAPAVLKQLDYLVGEAAFRQGMRTFLRRHAYGNATWRDLLDAIGGAAKRPLGPWGEQYFLRPGMPVLEQTVETRRGRITRLTLAQRPASERSGAGVWPMKTQVLLGYASRPAVRLPVDVRGATTVVSAAAGRAAPDFVFANAGDYAYALVLPDSASARWLERNVGTVRDPFLRAMLWGSLWDLVREARLSPARYLAAAARELPRETDEQIVAGVLGRVTRAARAYLSDAQRDSLVPALEVALHAGAADAKRSYGIRKAHLDALIRVATTPAATGYLDALLDSATVIGERLRPPTRWAIVTTLVEQGAAGAERRLAAEARRDSTSEGRRLAFIAGAARPRAETKRDYFTRYLRDTELNEDWVTGSLGAFNALPAQSLTLPYLRPALDTLRWVQQNRRIFFLGAWLSAFLEGQTSPEALATVGRYLDDNPTLPRDLMEKVLQAEDELVRTVRIRARFGGSGER